MPERRCCVLCSTIRPPMGRGFAASAQLSCGPTAPSVRAAIPCNELRTRTVMANNPKRMQDPTEAAMSAIQEALNLREEPPAAPRASEPAPPTAPAADPFANMTAEVAAERPARPPPSRSAPPIDKDLFLAETVGRAPAPAAIDEVKPV